MNIIVPSRYACLTVEDDNPCNKTIPKKKNDKPKKLPTGNRKAASAPKPQQPSANKKKKVKETSEKQWEEWKRKDNEVVNGNYQQDLETAILQSKLEYEENKDIYFELKKQADAAKKAAAAVGKQKKKNKAMSLLEFQNSTNSAAKETEKEVNMEEDSGKFFEKVSEDVKKELHKERMEERRKEINENIDENISIAQCKVELDRERTKNLELENQVKWLKDENTEIRTRNTMLCKILSQAEMKEKAEIVKEANRLSKVKDELTEEVSRLHALLEQERSKVAALSDSKHKGDKKNKKTNK